MPPRKRPERGYQWSEASGRYRDPASGRYVSRQAVRTALDNAIESSAAEMQALTQRLRSGRISLADWQLQMAREVKSVHLASAALARGGWAQMNPSAYGRVGQRLREQYAFLARFGEQIASGEQRLDGTVLRRAQMYVEAGRGTYHATEQAEMRVRGFDQEANVLHPADHCAGCLGETARGWVSIGMLVPVGARQCRTSCKCTVEYRRSAEVA